MYNDFDDDYEDYRTNAFEEDFDDDFVENTYDDEEDWDDEYDLDYEDSDEYWDNRGYDDDFPIY